MRSLICACNASVSASDIAPADPPGIASSSAHDARPARPAPSPFPTLPFARTTPIRSPG
ncbi:hypothetical protein [Variovorax sp. PAMC26660]|uniref:hypothetical protein n=1 Tax=Variovorax sp. PAMC26660 TaxID=2762322 RepID=UPI00164DAD03|nr:hypothetical protein [Variovorax sp. PAMC26660]QNK69234.1 hypothetical protein H7F35_05850 [Variovorax sp. PAMC26660]